MDQQPGRLFYFAVDVSAEMLKIGVRKVMEDATVADRVVPISIQMDFSQQSNISDLSAMVRNCCAEEPVLYSILGNTIGNFQNDEERLTTLVSVLGPDDRMLVEVSSINRADQKAASGP